ncbi:MAG: glycine zipper 2TM domain-containing protein [Gemmatimonadaceae bacterium]
MSQYTRGAGLTAAVALIALAGCGGGDAARKDTGLAADTALGRDLQLAGADTTAQPQLQDVPAGGGAAAPAPAPRASTPARTPTRTPTTTRPSTPAPAPATGGSGGGRVGTIGAGTSLSLASREQVCTNTNKVGQTFTARTTAPVTGTNGVSIPAGAIVTLEITRLKRSENANDPIVMEFAVRSIAFGGNSYPLTATIASASVDRVKNQPSSKDAQKVATGAAVGAIVGQVLGKDTKSTVIGGAVGAAAGAAAAKATSNYEGCIRDGGAIRITLNDAVQVKA